MEEGHAIKYVNRFSGGLKQYRKFDIILFFCRNNIKEKKRKLQTRSTKKKKRQIRYFNARITEKQLLSQFLQERKFLATNKIH